MNKNNSQNKFSNLHYMEEAIDLAKIAATKGDIPVGAILVDPKSGKIISSGHNRNNLDKDPTLHAEIICIRDACKKLDTKLLSGYDLYVTLEPCPMCATAISFAQISRVYYGAYDAKFGAIENGPRLFQNRSSLFAPEIYGGILEEKCAELLKNFFSDKR